MPTILATTEEATVQKGNVLQDPDIWMDDGNLIIAAMDEVGDKTATYLFKCHKSVLERQSQVFQALLSMPASSSSEDTYNGLPLVHLTDPYKDVKGLLHLLYEPLAVIPSARTAAPALVEATLEVLEGPVRLAAKYDFVKLHQHLVEVLEAHWPTTLPEWDLYIHSVHNLSPVPNVVAGAARAVKLGYQGQAACILPAAFYALHMTAVSDDYDTMAEYLRVRPVPFPEHRQEPFAAIPTLLAELDPLHIAHFMMGRERLMLLTTRLRYVLPIATSFAKGCKYLEGPVPNLRPDKEDERVTSCMRPIEAWWRREDDEEEGKGSHEWHADPFGRLKVLADGVAVQNLTEICNVCRTGLKDTLLDTRQYLWEELPYLFSVKPREEGVQYGYAHHLRRFCRVIP
ncbi:hypothetical protein BDW22DRAFT_913150 [Trametopsis cervina]|nr:hypothetical protein BDW22DRAFT_913150 [Trametopsis cervina]